MRFRFSGFGGSFSAPVVIHFEAADAVAARQAGLRVLQELPECERAEVVGGGQVITLVCATLPSAA